MSWETASGFFLYRAFGAMLSYVASFHFPCAPSTAEFPFPSLGFSAYAVMPADLVKEGSRVLAPVLHRRVEMPRCGKCMYA